MEHSSVKEDSIHATPETNENSLFYDLDPYPQFSSCIPPGLNRTTSAAKSDIVYTDIRGTVEIKGFDSRASGGAWGIGNGSSRKTQRMTSTSNFTPKPPSNELENPSTRARIFSDGSNAQGQPTAKINRITSMERIRDKFATNDVRIQGVFFTDMWSYIKNSHPFFGMFTAEKFHPYKKLDRFLVLLVSILLAFILCGVFATQPCCNSSPVKSSSFVTGSRRLSTIQNRILFQNPASSEFTCHPFGSQCHESKRQLCTVGSTCQLLSDKNTRQCVPTVTQAPFCTSKENSSISSCPSGWICREVGKPCVPNRKQVCYLPKESISTVANEADKANGGDAFDISLNLIDSSPTKRTFEQTLRTTPPVVELPAPLPSQPEIFPTQIPMESSTGSTPVLETNENTPISSNNLPIFDNIPNITKETPVPVSANVMSFALVSPSGGDSFEIGSVLPIRWKTNFLQEANLPIQAFTIQFRKDGSSNFRTIATDIKSFENTDQGSVFTYDWRLDENDNDVLCEECVLRICVSQPSLYATLCFQSDKTVRSSMSNSESNEGKLLFRIIKATTTGSEVTTGSLACSKTCGLAHAKFEVFPFLIALCIPLSILLLEETVTFYQNSKFFGLFTRRDTPHLPYLGSYQIDASRIGRIFLIVTICVLCLFMGIVSARVNSTNFDDAKNKIVQLWTVVFILTVVIGFLYCTMVYCIIFSVKWYAEAFLKRKREVPVTDVNTVLVANSFNSSLG